MEMISEINKEKFYSFFNKALFCCMPKKEEFQVDFPSKQNKEQDEIIYNNDEIINGVYSIFPSKYVREDEKKYFKFTRDYIINYLSELSQKNFINKYDETTLKLSILDNNELSDNIPVIRSERIIPKSCFKKYVPSLEEMIAVILTPELRLKSDINFKEFKIIKKINANTQITKMVSKPQITLIPEREFYEKKTFFVDNGVFYSFCSSIPDDIFPPQKNITRALTYLCAMIIKEDKEKFFIDSFNQIDMKMNIPEVLIVMSYPMKMKEQFDGLMDIFNN